MVLIELTGPIHAVAGGGGSGMGRAGGRTPSVMAGQDATLCENAGQSRHSSSVDPHCITMPYQATH